MRKSTIPLALGAALFALPAIALGQAGDSSIRGTVTDDSGAVLPGATVTAMSNALIAAATTVTDSQGSYRLLNLPVGEYALEASLSGFATYRQEGVLLRASTNIGIDPVLSISSVQETVTVTAETPMLEITRPGNILTIEGDLQRDLPIQARGNWSDFLEMTPGVNARPFDDASGRMVYFGHATEHFAHVIQLEGMAASGYTDSQVTYVGMNADMMEDMSVKTGGAEAKDPMGTGLVINVVTKSGGNDLTASAAYDLQSFDWGTGDENGLGGFFGDNELPDNFEPFASEKANFASLGAYDPPDGRSGAAGTPTAHQVRQADFSFGGPIMRDKAWFFASYRYADLGARISRSGVDVDRLTALSGVALGGLGAAPTYSPFLNTTKSHQPYVKVSAQLSPSHELNLYYQRDTTENTSNREYDLAPRFTVQTGGNLYGGKLTSVFGANTTGQFTVSYNDKAYQRPLDLQPQRDSLPLFIQIYDSYSVNSSGTTGTGGRLAAAGTPSGFNAPARLLLLRADLTRYVDDVAGSHEFSFGVYAAPSNRYPQTIDYTDANGWTNELHVTLDANGEPTDDLTQAVGTRWFSRSRTGDEQSALATLDTIDATDRDIGVYLQDAWKPVERLTLNLGVRADFVRRHDGIRDFERMNTIAIGPRAGFAYQMTEDGRNILRGSYGRVHEQMNGRDNITRVHGGASAGSYVEYDHDGDGVADHDNYSPPVAGLPTEALFDPDIGQPFVDEFIAGVRRQFRGQFAMDVALVHRRYTETYALLEQNGYWPSETPASVPREQFQYGRVSLDQARINQQTNNTWSKLVYTAIEVTSTRRTEKMSATLNISRQWQHFSGDWNSTDPARFISPEKFPSNKALYMPRGNNEHNTLRDSNSTSYNPTWRQYSIRGGLSYLLPFGITTAVSYTGNAGPWSGPPLQELDADDPQVTQYGPGRTNNDKPNPLSTRYRIVGQDRAELQVQAPTVHTVGLSLGKIFELGAAQFEVQAQVFNLLDAANHNQFTYSGANRAWKANFLELRSRQNARTMLLRGTLRF